MMLAVWKLSNQEILICVDALFLSWLWFRNHLESLCKTNDLLLIVERKS